VDDYIVINVLEYKEAKLTEEGAKYAGLGTPEV